MPMKSPEKALVNSFPGFHAVSWPLGQNLPKTQVLFATPSLPVKFLGPIPAPSLRIGSPCQASSPRPCLFSKSLEAKGKILAPGPRIDRDRQP